MQEKFIIWNPVASSRCANARTVYFFVSKKLGVAGSWLRRWRYRMYLHRASFLHEGVLLRLLDPTVQARVRVQLARAWGREILWRRSADAEPVARDQVGAQVQVKFF